MTKFERVIAVCMMIIAISITTTSIIEVATWVDNRKTHWNLSHPRTSCNITCEVYSNE